MLETLLKKRGTEIYLIDLNKSKYVDIFVKIHDGGVL